MKRQGGGKGKRRKAASVADDDRPRGFEAQRMRQLWRDIDHAKRKAGLDPEPDPVDTPFWDLGGVIGRATAFAGEAASWMTAAVPTAAACSVLASGAELLRSVPIVGRFVDSLSGSHTGGGNRDGHADSVARINGKRAAVERPEGDANGKWVD